jgi:hypothetical protein
MKKIFYFLFISVIVFSSCQNDNIEKSGSSEIEKTVTRKIEGFGFEMTAPTYLKDSEKKFGELVYIKDVEKEIYFQFYKTDKTLFKYSLANRKEIPEETDLLPTFHRNFAESASTIFENSGFKMKSQPVTTKITVNDSKAIQSEFILELEGNDFNYSLISIDAKNDYYYIYCWYIKSTSEKHKDDIVKMLNSIKLK